MALPGERDAVGIAVGVPVGVMTFSFALVADQAARGLPVWTVAAAFVFFLVISLAAVVFGYMLSGFRKRAAGVFLVGLMGLPPAMGLGWGLSETFVRAFGAGLPAVVRAVVSVSGYYLVMAVLLAVAAADLHQAWARRARERSDADRPA